MLLASDAAASNGHYIVQTATTGTGSVSFTVNVPAAGTWRLAGRVIAPGGDANSFTYAFDASSSATWALPEVTGWTWADGPSVSLTAGTHTLTLGKRELRSQLDVVRLVKVS